MEEELVDSSTQGFYILLALPLLFPESSANGQPHYYCMRRPFFFNATQIVKKRVRMGVPSLFFLRRPFPQSLLVTVFGQFLIFFLIIANNMEEKMFLIVLIMEFKIGHFPCVCWFYTHLVQVRNEKLKVTM